MFVEIIKLLLSKDTRESIQAGVGALTRAPAWKEDLLVVGESFDADREALAGVLVAHAAKELARKGWPEERIGVAQFVADELIRNAFAHGAKGTTDLHVGVRARLTSQWAEFSVSDNGEGFSLGSTLESQVAAPKGLTFVQRASAALTQRSPTAVIARVDLVANSRRVVDDGEIFLVRVGGRLDHEHAREFEAALGEFPVPSRVIIDLRGVTYISSVGLRVFFLLAKKKQESSFDSDRVVLMSPTPIVAEVLAVSHFDRVLPVAKSEEEARALVLADRPRHRTQRFQEDGAG